MWSTISISCVSNTYVLPLWFCQAYCSTKGRWCGLGYGNNGIDIRITAYWATLPGVRVRIERRHVESFYVQKISSFVSFWRRCIETIMFLLTEPCVRLHSESVAVGLFPWPWNSSQYVSTTQVSPLSNPFWNCLHFCLVVPPGLLRFYFDICNSL